MSRFLRDHPGGKEREEHYGQRNWQVQRHWGIKELGMWCARQAVWGDNHVNGASGRRWCWKGRLAQSEATLNAMVRNKDTVPRPWGISGSLPQWLCLHFEGV